MPAGRTPYNIGAVFRTGTCPYSSATRHRECLAAKTGKDQNCENVYILRIDQPSGSDIPSSNIQDNSGNPFPALSAKYISVCAGVSAGIDDLNPSFKGVSAYPVPFNNLLTIQFQYFSGAKPKVEIFDMLGNKMADLSSQVTNGDNTLSWNGKNAAGNSIAAGFYLVQISNGDQTYTGKVIKQ